MESKSLLHSHIRLGDVEAVIDQLKQGTNVEAKNIFNSIPLHLAVQGDSEKILEVLLDAGANVNSQDDLHRTALHHTAMKKSALGVTFASCLLTYGADINSQDVYGVTPLAMAAMLDNPYVFKKLLEAGANINQTDNFGRTVLHRLAIAPVLSIGTDLLLQLLDQKPDLNSQDSNGDTPLNLSVKFENKKMFKFLLDVGADVNARNKEGLVPLHNIVIHAKPAMGVILATEILNLRYKVDINAKDNDGNTPLHMAAKIRCDKEELVKLFLRSKADVYIKNNEGHTPLVHEIICGNVSMVRCMINHGVDVNKPVGEGEELPLKLALAHKNRNLIKCLLQNDADVNVLDDKKKTIFMNELAQGGELLRLFLKYGADVNVSCTDNSNILKNSFLPKSSWKVILEHIARLQALEIPVNPSLVSTISGRDEFKKYFEEYLKTCEDELVMAKKMKLGNSWVSFYNLLTDHESKLVKYAGNRDLVEIFGRANLKKRFPVYKTLMKKKMNEGIRGRKLRDCAAATLSEQWKIDPNHLGLHKILDCLSKKDLACFRR